MMKAALYARVSTHDKGQDPELQLQEMREYCRRMGWHIYKEYVDYESGAKSDRKQLTALLKDARLKKFDVLLVWKLDRLARSLKQLVELLDNLRAWNVEFKCMTQDIDTTTAHGKLLFHIIAAFAEFERELIRERVKAGIEKAKRKGKKLGRPNKVTPELAEEIRQRRREGWSIGKLAERYKLGRATIHRIING